MRIEYRTSKLKKQCTDLKKAKKAYGDKIARRLLKAINFIESADNLHDLISFKPYNFHPLKGDRKGQYAIDIGSRRDGYRLILEFYDDEVYENALIIVDTIVVEMGNHYE